MMQVAQVAGCSQPDIWVAVVVSSTPPPPPGAVVAAFLVFCLLPLDFSLVGQ
jgi:hypothetical protein